MTTLEEVLAGNFTTEERMTLSCRVVRDGLPHGFPPWCSTTWW